ncbi:uncharacterized protein PADG_11837 [Paracoccidioides brasiliensis Pb18]|uniref:Uncharacterized protein n=1 Tax=Paracoccidioides brasiliensis (strain Pb18) TaxID=502780 RepID=A0A0A0HVH6_PARBD|nr:uncharacterized protein PADG_11837 [Paracoccidioides brasiliensis Pb18]KGM92046.1 hypothetical protein PADG_11837 [Paracoccidioides brasiliensis Pb18]
MSDQTSSYAQVAAGTAGSSQIQGLSEHQYERTEHRFVLSRQSSLGSASGLCAGLKPCWDWRGWLWSIYDGD